MTSRDVLYMIRGIVCISKTVVVPVASRDVLYMIRGIDCISKTVVVPVV